jgi:hypothetical protein
VFTLFTCKDKEILVQAYYRPIAFQEVEASRFLDSRRMEMVSLSVVLTVRLYTKEIHLVVISVIGWVNAKSFEPTIFRFVAQCFNQLRHPVSPSPCLQRLPIFL